VSIYDRLLVLTISSAPPPTMNPRPLLASLVFVFIAHAVQAIDLPIEVAAGNTTAAVTSPAITFTTSKGGANVNRLRFKVHNLHNGNQMSVRLNNNSTWTAVSNTTSGMSVNARGGIYGGVGGGYHTIEIDLNLPSSGAGSINNGSNTIQFRLNPPYDSGVSAFRVLGFSILDSGNADVITSTFDDISPGQGSDNNTSWIASNTQANVDAGRNAFQNLALKEYPGGGNIAARCADCNTIDGRDLKYFGFSNRSIYQRARFHNLTDTQAKNLTRYIRSLNDSPTNEAWGRPWNPPYQPSTAFASTASNPRAAKDWAAGGGLGAVLATDEEMRTVMFPNGTDTQAKIDAVVDTSKTIETFAIPIAMQFPDWNRWLPTVYPGDIWSSFETSNVYSTYLDIRDKLKTNGFSYYNANNTRREELVELLSSLNNKVREWIGDGATTYDPGGSTGGSPWRARDSTRLNSASSVGYDREVAKLAMTFWLGVKYFEIMREFNLEDKSPQLLQYDPRAQGEFRGWPTRGQNVHPNAPHITSMNLNNWVGQDPLLGDYLSSVWYHLQMCLNAGQGQNTNSVQPQDWEYQLNHIEQVSRRTGVQHPLRMVLSMLKIFQTRDNQLTVNNGWMLRMCDPTRLYSDESGDTTMMGTLDSYGAGLWKRVNNAFIKEFVEVVTNPAFEGSGLAANPNNWPRYTLPNSNNEDWFMIEPPTYVPVEWNDGPKFTLNHANTYWRLLPDLQKIGCDATRLTDLKNWCKAAWPGPSASPNDWDLRLTPLLHGSHVWHNLLNVQHSKRLYGESLVGSDATLATNTGGRVQWMSLPTGGSWFRLQRKQYTDTSDSYEDGMDYWLRAMDNDKVRIGTPSNLGDQTQWRALDLGGGQYRVENKNAGYSTAPWLRAATSTTVDRAATTVTGNSTKWQFIPIQ
jgi:hypothetical protein